MKKPPAASVSPTIRTTFYGLPPWPPLPRSGPEKNIDAPVIVVVQSTPLESPLSLYTGGSMPIVDIDVGLTDEEQVIRDVTHKFA